MNQLTVRGIDKDLQRCLREFARRQGVSLNRVAVTLMRRGAGLDQSLAAGSMVGGSLDRFVGSWSDQDEREVLHEISVFEEIEPKLWRWPQEGQAGSG
jgi:hypothetical protein